jgi:flagellar M-ring protein FliF
MDLLNRAYLQLYERFRSMTPGSRLTAGLSAAVVLASLGYLVTHQASSPDVDLMHGATVSASQLQKMEAALGDANLSGYEIRGTSIFVPRGQESVFMAALTKGKALPPNFGAAQHEAASGGSWMELGSQREREKMKIAKQETLAMAIEKMPGIESAYVIYDVDNSPGAFREKLITASALVSGKIDEAMVSTIRQMVAGAIAGLKPENVTVSDLTASKSYGNSTAAGSADDNLYVCLKRTYEQDLTTKILNALAFIPNVTVALSVELDRERILRGKQLKRAPDATDQLKAPQAGPTPPSSQRPNVATVLDNLLGGPPNGDAAAEPKNGSLGIRPPAERETAGPTPVSARVSVGVPASYFKKIWQERNPSQPGATVRMPDASALNQIDRKSVV